MKRPSIIILTVIIGLAITGFLLAKSDRKKKDHILDEFKKVNSRLDSLNSSVDKSRADLLNAYDPLVLMGNRILALTDSLKEKYMAMDTVGKEIDPDVKRLLVLIREFNKFKWDMVDSRVPDTVRYWPDKSDFNENRWLSEFFGKYPKEVSVTYLSYLQNETERCMTSN